MILLTTILLSGNFRGSYQNKSTSGNSRSIFKSSFPEISNDSLFFDFFEHFMWDQEFQKSRVKVPFLLEGKTVKTAEEWKHLPFYSSSPYISMLSSDTLSLIERDVQTKETDLFIVNFERDHADKFAFKNSDGHWYLQGLETIHSESIPDKAFILFLKSFSTNAVFQKKHIAFPLSTSFADSDNDYKTVSKTISSEDWAFWKLSDEINKLLILSNIQSDNKFRNIFIRGVDNGIWLKYTFEKRNDDWTLIKIEDYTT